MTAGWCSRTLRTAVFAAVCVLLAALGHVLMSGSHVPAWALAAGLTGTGAAGWCLAGRERGSSLIVTVVVVAQAVLHEAFSLAQASSGGTASKGMASVGMASVGMGSMDMGSMRMDATDAMDGMGHMSMNRMMHMDHMGHMGPSTGGAGSSYGMLAAHLLAALLTGLWLAYGEKAAFRILRTVAGRLAAPLRLLLALPPAPDRRRVRPRRPRSDRTPSLRPLVHAITSRGPPAGTAVV
ncbi:hypothetical protein ABT075_17000 [Streptomyces sp. NPDC002677]|uniref:hypothetical protein n=1 Tax=Streptomyces sp. NPDC002677 TaxID=3154774 RepID=UPI00331EA030